MCGGIFRLLRCLCLPGFPNLNRAGPAGAPALHPRAWSTRYGFSWFWWNVSVAQVSLSTWLSEPQPSRACRRAGPAPAGMEYVVRVFMVLVECFGCSGVFVYLAFRTSTEQGLPARRPCTRALSVIRLNHCTLPRVPSFRLRASGPPLMTVPVMGGSRGHPCPLARPCASTRQ